MHYYNKYIITRIAGPMLLICMTLTGIAWLTQSLRFVDMIVNRGLSVGTFLYLSSLIVPSILWIIIPVALFISVLYVYHKLITDSELIVMRNAGLSPQALVKPALLFASAVTILNYIIGLYLLPASYREFKDIQVFIRDNYASVLLQEGVFASPTDGLTVYIRERNRDGTLSGMMVHDNRDDTKTVTMMAEQGQLVQSTNGPMFLLENGNRQEINVDRGELSLLYFERYALELGLLNTDINNRRWREPKERYIGELFSPNDTGPEHIRQLYAEGHHRLTWPLHNLVFALMALVPFMVGQYNRKGQPQKIFITSGITVGIVILSLTLKGLIVQHSVLTSSMYLILVLAAAILSYLMFFRRALPSFASRGV